MGDAILRMRILALGLVIAGLEFLRDRVPHILYGLHRRRHDLLLRHFIGQKEVA